MKIDVTLTLEEFVAILREGIKNATGYEVKDISIESYNKTKIIIHEDGLVESDNFSHRIN